MNEKAIEQIVSRTIEAAGHSAASPILDAVVVLGGIAIVAGVIAMVILRIYKPEKKSPDDADRRGTDPDAVTHGQIVEQITAVKESLKEFKDDVKSRLIGIDKDIRELRTEFRGSKP